MQTPGEVWLQERVEPKSGITTKQTRRPTSIWKKPKSAARLTSRKTSSKGLPGLALETSTRTKTQREKFRKHLPTTGRSTETRSVAETEQGSTT